VIAFSARAADATAAERGGQPAADIPLGGTATSVAAVESTNGRRCRPKSITDSGFRLRAESRSAAVARQKRNGRVDAEADESAQPRQRGSHVRNGSRLIRPASLRRRWRRR
jgi:hypothetical protein